MAATACTDPDCPEYELAKDNPFGFPADAIACGACFGPVTDAPDPDPDAAEG